MLDTTTLELIGFLYPENWVPFTDSQGREVQVHLDHADGSLFVDGRAASREDLAEGDLRGRLQRTPDESSAILTDIDAVLTGTWVPDGLEFRTADQGNLPR